MKLVLVYLLMGQRTHAVEFGAENNSSVAARAPNVR